MMKRQYLRILMVLVGVAGFGVAAKAQSLDRVVVTIPHQFEAAGKTFPAGIYEVKRADELSKFPTLIFSSVENHVSTLLVASTMEPAAPEKPELSFEQVGDQHFLSKIETGDHVFTLLVSHSAKLETAAQSHTGTATGSTAGSN
jgi:hypothetical protein